MGASGMPQETEVAALLNLFMYLNRDAEENGKRLGDILKKAESDLEAGLGDELKILQDAIKGSHPELADMRVTIPDPDKYDGINAAVFTNGNDVYVVYRGTGDGKWIDNGEGMTERMTESQQQAIEFLDEMARQHGWDESTNLTVTGHSKGGNNSQVATMGAENGNLVDQCISFDGQGVSPAGEEYYREILGDAYAERQGKMYSVNGENDPVHQIGVQIIPEENTYYIETNSGDGELLPTHALQYLFKTGEENGNPVFSDRINPEADGQGAIAKYAERLNEILMKMPEDMREDCAISAMQLIEFFSDINNKDQLLIGYNGHQVSADNLDGFRVFGLPVILFSLLGTSEGQEAVMALLEEAIQASIEQNGIEKTIADIAAIILAFPFALGLTNIVLENLADLMRVVEILERLGVLTDETKAFIKECWEAVKDFIEDVKNWVKENIMGRTVITDADFCVDYMVLIDAAEGIKNLADIYKGAALEVASIRRRLQLKGYSGWALQTVILTLEGNLEDGIRKSEKMAGVLEDCAKSYWNSERKICDNAAAAVRE